MPLTALLSSAASVSLAATMIATFVTGGAIETAALSSGLAIAGIAALGVVWGRRWATPAARLTPELQLLRCRRREEPATVVVAAVQDAREARAALATLRLTDGVAVRTRGEGLEVQGVLDGEDARLSAAVERRLSTITPPLSVGWARYPADGLTLDRLLAQARRSAAERDPALAADAGVWIDGRTCEPAG